MKCSLKALNTRPLTVLAALVGTILLTLPANVAGAASATLYVSPSGSSSQSGQSCATAKYSTISSAVAAAPAGDTVVACKGTYTEEVVIAKSLKLLGKSAKIDATGLGEGIVVVASNVTVSGFTVSKAQGAGIAVLPAGAPSCSTGCTDPLHVTVSKNVVVNDDQAYVPPAGCPANIYPGDCGGGILFDAVADSTLSHNVVEHNVDGILVVDDFGPAHNNLITGNTVIDNVNECGITLPSHNSSAASYLALPNGSYKITGLNPAKGGVYDNTVTNNVANGNGTGGYKANAAGSGAGILLASAGPGTAVYNNLIKGNEASGNGLAGVTLHAHYTGGEYLNGNKIEDNIIGKNNVSGDTLDTPISAADFLTTGITLFTATPIKVTVANNIISKNAVGIWATPNVKLTGSNTFRSVSRHVYISNTPYGTAFTAVAVTASSATLIGLGVPNGSQTVAYFQWGTSPLPPLYTATPPQSLGSGTGIVAAAAHISGLSPSTTYYFVLVVTNKSGTSTGLTESFKTAAS